VFHTTSFVCRAACARRIPHHAAPRVHPDSTPWWKKPPRHGWESTVGEGGAGLFRALGFALLLSLSRCQPGSMGDSCARSKAGVERRLGGAGAAPPAVSVLRRSMAGEGDDIGKVFHIGLVGLMTLAGALILFGCSGDDNDTQTPATANDVNNKTFAFSSGEVFNPALRNAATTLAFSNNGANFTLASAGGTATGKNQFGSCILTITSSTYASGVGPQVNEVITLNPCMVDSATNVLTAQNGTITARGAVGNLPPRFSGQSRLIARGGSE
jgi:hypothetical protein